MDIFKPSTLFDLQAFKHKSLFYKGFNEQGAELKWVWEVLDQLHAYLENQPKGIISTNIPQGAYLVDQELISIGQKMSKKRGMLLGRSCWGPWMLLFVFFSMWPFGSRCFFPVIQELT